ncbi:hypothetical protein LPJ81_001717, partial [Coemansia sp. IMI 209127]
SPQHLRFATNERNWLELDTLLENVKRPAKKPQPVVLSGPSDYAALVLSSDDGSIPQTPAVINSATDCRVLSLASGDVAAATASAPASIGANWNVGAPISLSLAPSYMATSVQMLASGRLSTETGDNTDAATIATPAPNRHRGTRVSGSRDIIDLSFSNSNTNSSCTSPRPLSHDGSVKQHGTSFATPAPRRGADTSNSIESLVMSLETPEFQDRSLSAHCDEATTLVGNRLDRYSRLSHYTPAGKHGSTLETPTRNNSALNILDGATLSQPNRTGLLPEHSKLNDSDEPLVNSIRPRTRLLHSENEPF